MRSYDYYGVRARTRARPRAITRDICSGKHISLAIGMYICARNIRNSGEHIIYYYYNSGFYQDVS